MMYRQVAAAGGLPEPKENPPPEAVDRIATAFGPALRPFGQVMRKTICEKYNIEKEWSVAYDVR